MSRVRWQDRAACAGMPTDLFVSGGNGDPKDPTRAKAACAACSVRAACLRYALHTGDPGVWGGTTAAERRQLRQARSTATATV